MKRIYNFMSVMSLMTANLSLFDGSIQTNRTTDENLSVEMKTYYHGLLIDNAEPELVHDRFAQKTPVPQNGGKICEFRRYAPLPKLTTPITEGVTPKGQKYNVSGITVNVEQYGGFIEISDILILTAIDNNIVQVTKLLGSQAGRTLDTITREVINGGTNVIFAGGKNARFELSGGAGDETDCYFSADLVAAAVRKLKAMNARKIDGYYAAIINQDCSHDLMRDPNWKYPHQYVDTKNIYEGEIGMLHGCRFFETSEAKVFHADDLCEGSRVLTVDTLVDNDIGIKETLTDADALALVGRKILVEGKMFTVVSATTNSITADRNVEEIASGEAIYPGEAGAEGRDVYSTIFFGEDAYGTVEITGGGLEHIIKQLGSGGTSDPLNQRATCGWKATKAAVRLVEEFMVRVESCSTFNDIGEN